jgi:hypothetical protein
LLLGSLKQSIFRLFSLKQSIFRLFSLKQSISLLFSFIPNPVSFGYKICPRLRLINKGVIELILNFFHILVEFLLVYHRFLLEL